MLDFCFFDDFKIKKVTMFLSSVLILNLFEQMSYFGKLKLDFHEYLLLFPLYREKVRRLW